MSRTKIGLRHGYTTGACAAAAAKAAALALAGGGSVTEVEIALPGGDRARLPVHRCLRRDGIVLASVITVSYTHLTLPTN